MPGVDAMSTSAAAAAVAATVSMNNPRRNSLGEMPKMPWVWVCDQRTPSQPRKLPVPKYFQSGNEHVGKLTWESMKKWLSRGVERQVTSAWIAVEQPGKSEWHLHEVPVQLSSSPFKDGTLVVVCCGNESLNPNVSGQLPPPVKLRPFQNQASSDASVLGGKMWKSARSRVLATMAFSQPATIFGKRLSNESDRSLASAASAASNREAFAPLPEDKMQRETEREVAEAEPSVPPLKPAIKKGKETKAIKGVRTEGGKLGKAKPRLKFEGHEEDAMDVPAECHDLNDGFNAPVKPWLLSCGPAPKTMTRATQTEPLKVRGSCGRCCRCHMCCCDGYEDSDILHVQ